MSTLHKVKAYFGMAPMDDYEDEYYEGRRPGTPAPGVVGDSTAAAAAIGSPRTPTRRAGRPLRGARPLRRPRRRLPAHRRLPRRLRRRAAVPSPRVRAFARSAAALAVRHHARPRPGRARDGPAPDGHAVRRGQPVVENHLRCGPGTTTRARTIGERFRDGQPVIMDLVSMDNADAKRLSTSRPASRSRPARILRQGRHQGVPAGPGRCRRLRRGAPPDRRGGLLQLSVTGSLLRRAAVGYR